jgi:hypothetical protein
VREAFEALRHGRAISTSLDWDTIAQTAEWYVEQKATQHRFDGQAAPGTFDEARVPTWDILDCSERIS